MGLMVGVRKGGRSRREQSVRAASEWMWIDVQPACIPNGWRWRVRVRYRNVSNRSGKSMSTSATTARASGHACKENEVVISELSHNAASCAADGFFCRVRTLC